jgi:hypothetical protein
LRFRRRIALGLCLTAVLALLLGTQACTTSPVSMGVSPYRVTLVVDGRREIHDTRAPTVGAFLVEVGVLIGNLDRVQPPETTSLTDQLTITVVRVEQITHVVTQTIAFERQVVRDALVPLGETRLLQAGQAGVLERQYRIILEDRQETERALIREVMIQPPQHEVRLVGAQIQPGNVAITGALAYLSQQDAWIMRESSFQRRRLTVLGDLDGHVFELSPDARHLLFTRAVTESDRLNSLWLVRTTEAAPNPVPLNVDDVLWADWAPDGEHIAWSSAEVTEQAPGWRGNNDLWVATLTRQTTLASRRQVLEPEPGGGHGWWGTRYAWAPSGERLASSRPDSVGIVTVPGGQQTQIARFPAFRTFSSWAWHPAVSWSPEGTYVATVVHGGEGDEKPEESPVFSLAVLEAEGTFSATLSLEVGMWANPHYAPDGEHLLFGRAITPNQSATSLYTLHLMDRDGSNQRTLATPGPGLETPEWIWRSDGQAIAFLHLGDIFVMDLASNATEALTNEGNVTLIRWR